jgi:hypothetical protein
VARRVFFSFHYDEDITRAQVVRNSDVTKDWDPNVPVDHASWEEIKRKGDENVKRWINQQLDGAGVTAVLIGAYTYTRKFVLYEIARSFELGKGLLGIRIHQIKDFQKQTAWPGTNPLEVVKTKEPLWPGSTLMNDRPLSSKFKTYDWVDDNGYLNFSKWAEEAARLAGR